MKRTRSISRSRGVGFALIGLGMLVAGCTLAADHSEVEDPPISVGDAQAAGDSRSASDAARPEVVRGAIVLEGMRQPMTYHLYRSPEAFPLPFSTYVPEDMVAEQRPSELPQVRFVANFGGERRERMYLAVQAFPKGWTTAQARQRLRQVASELGEAVRASEPLYPWELESYRSSGAGGVRGSVALGRHGERYFLLVSHFPEEAGDGFLPRQDRILDAWRWSEGGPLGS